MRAILLDTEADLSSILHAVFARAGIPLTGVQTVPALLKCAEQTGPGDLWIPGPTGAAVMRLGMASTTARETDRHSRPLAMTTMSLHGIVTR